MGAGAAQKTGTLLVPGYLARATRKVEDDDECQRKQNRIPGPEVTEEETGNDGMSLLWSETSRLAGWLCVRCARHRRATNG